VNSYAKPARTEVTGVPLMTGAELVGGGGDGVVGDVPTPLESLELPLQA
jgi:hypothetical protein